MRVTRRQTGFSTGASAGWSVDTAGALCASRKVGVARTGTKASNKLNIHTPCKNDVELSSGSCTVGKSLGTAYIQALTGCSGRHVPHGWRATFSTVMNERAIAAGTMADREIIGAMLAQKSKGTPLEHVASATFQPIGSATHRSMSPSYQPRRAR